MKKALRRLLSLVLCATMLLGAVGEIALSEETAGIEAAAAETPVPATESPATESPATDAPATDAPATDVPKTDAPETTAPETEVPETEAPETQVPETEAPETEAPETEAPETEAPLEEELLLPMALIAPLSSNIFKDGDATYTYQLNTSGDKVIITEYSGNVAALSIPSSILGLPVESIADGAFRNASMATLVIPGNLSKIGADAFKNCANLTSVTIGGGTKEIGAGAFEGCAKLVSVIVSSGTESIGAGAFKDCVKLKDLVLPMNTLTFIAPGAFAGTGSTFRINNSVPFLFSLKDGKIAIEGYRGTDANLTIPSTLLGKPVGSVGAGAFENSTLLTGVTIQAGVTGIGAGAFKNCDKLLSVSLPAGLETIGASAFYDCDALTAVTIPAGVSTISDSAFFSCAKLATVTIESGVHTIGDSAFKNCDKLASLRVPDSVTSIHPSAFDGCDLTLLLVVLDGNTGTPYQYFSQKGAKIDYDEVILDSMFVYEGNVANSTAVITGYTGEVLHLTIPATINGYRIVAIDENAFAGNTKMVRLTIPGTIREIGAGAFEGCSQLEEVVVQSGTTTIGDEAFKGCGALKRVVLPLGTLNYIGDDAFEGCKDIQSFAGSTDYVFSLHRDVDGGVTIMDYIGSAAAVTVPAQIGGLPVARIGAGAFKGSGITSVALGANVRFIGAGAFEGEKLLASVVLNDKLNSIGARAFADCAKIARIELPASLLEIGAAAFSGTDLQAVEIPKYVRSIADDAFDGAKLTSILVDNANTSFIALDNALYTLSGRELVRYFGTAALVDVPSGTKAVRAGAFRGRKSVSEIRLPDTLTAIGAEAFAEIPLTKIFVPDSVTAIAADAFLNVNKANLVATVESDTGYPHEYFTDAGISVVVRGSVKPTGITLDSMILGVGEVVKLAPKVEPAGATTGISYRISNATIADVDSLGQLRAKKVGVAVLYAETDNGIETACTVTVLKAPTAVYLSESSVTLGIGETRLLQWALSSGAYGSVTLTSDNPFVATVNADGVVEAIGKGNATITARTYNNRTAICRVSVLAEPTELSLIAEAGTLGIGQQYLLKGTLDNGQGNGALSFRSDNAAVASVAADGTIIAKRLGFATITVSAYNAAAVDEDLTKTFSVAVVPAPTSVRFATASGSLAVGQTHILQVILPTGTAAGMTFKSSKTSVATVNAAGVVTGKKAGTAYIAVTTHNGKTATCKVTVKKAPSSIKLNVSSVRLGAGNTYALKYKLTSGTSATVTYSSSNELIATVSSSGVITAVASSGSAVITARTHNGKTARCTVYAVAAPASVKLNDWFLDLGVKESYQLTGGVYDALGNDVRSIASHYKFASSDSSIASVSATGKVLAKKAGTAIISLSTYNGLETTCIVTVSSAPSRVTLKYDGKTVNNTTGIMAVGETLTLTAELPAGCGGSYSFRSSNSSIASVDKYTGEVYARRKGIATIGVKTYNGKIATCKIRVI